MQEITVKNNQSGLKIFINGVPQLSLIPKEQIEVVAKALEKRIDEHFDKKSRLQVYEIK